MVGWKRVTVIKDVLENSEVEVECRAEECKGKKVCDKDDNGRDNDYDPHALKSSFFVSGWSRVMRVHSRSC